MCLSTMYQQLKDAEVIVGINGQDVFVLDCNETREILANWPVYRGISVRLQDGDRWLWEIPMAYSDRQEDQREVWRLARQWENNRIRLQSLVN